MPTLLHEALLELFRNRPSLAVDLVRDALHAPLPAFDEVRVGDANLTDLVPTEFRADLVLLLEGLAKGAPNGALVVEVQLRADGDKRWSWPVYVTSLRARLRCDVTLLVVTGDTTVAAWAAKPIETGHPRFALTPLVMGPGAVPVVVDEAEATRAPELAVLSLLVHGHAPEALDIARAALAGARGLDEERAALYVDLVFASVGEAARRVLEALMANGTYQYQSEFAKRYVAQGRDEGRVEGRLEGRVEGRDEGRVEGLERGRADGLRDAIAHVLAARSLTLSDGGRIRVAACSDIATLTAWLERAATAAAEADVFVDAR
jgi:hypothetical protein